MSKLLPLALILVVLASGCINFDGSKSMFGIFEVTDNPNLYMNVEVSTNDVKAGRDVKMQFTVRNPGEEPLENFQFTAYNMCLFTGESTKTYDLLKANESKIWTWTWTAKDTISPVDCKVKFRTSYDTTGVFSSTINVLQEAEYYSREADETLDEIFTTTTATDTTVDVGISFSEEQPFLEGEDIYTYIDYSYSGRGQVIKLNKNDVIIQFPTNVIPTCSNYDFKDGNEYYSNYTLNKDLTFINGKAPQTTCKLTTAANQPIQSGDMRLTVKYKYQFDDSLLLGVKPK